MKKTFWRCLMPPASLPSALAVALKNEDLGAMTAALGSLPLEPQARIEMLESYTVGAGGALKPAQAQWFVDQGISIIHTAQSQGQGPVDWMSQALAANNAELVGWLAKTQKLADRRLPSAGPTPLMEALLDERWPMAEVLLAHGADIDGINLHGQTALHQAAMGYKVNAMVWLMSHGSNPLIEDKFNHLPSELVPQDPGEAWRPDDVYAWLQSAEQINGIDRQIIPQSVINEALVEKLGLSFTNRPPADWTEEERLTASVLVERGLIEPPEYPDTGAPADPNSSVLGRLPRRR
jgi:hypothetical protein